MLNGLITALRTLSIFPVPGRESNRPSSALPWFVVVGAVLGGIHVLIAMVLLRSTPGMTVFAGLLLAVLNYTLTGALHIDGLADTADAFGTPHDREKTLAILKDPHIGSFGVVAIVCIVLWRLIAMQELLTHDAVVWTVFGLGTSRILQALVLSTFPYSRGTEGKAYGYSGGRWIVPILLLQFAGVVSLGCVLYGVIPVLIPFAIAVAAGSVPVLLYMKRIGGVTGDCIGAMTEVYEVVFLSVVGGVFV